MTAPEDHLQTPELLVEEGENGAGNEAEDPWIGRVVAANIVVQSLIGCGGMCAVYKARHRLLNRAVAVKVMLPHLLKDRNTIMRFKNEAQAASSLHHPNIVATHDFGIAPDGQPYLVMDYLEGQSLAELIKVNGPLEVEQVLRIFEQACDGLEHAHEKGIVHRDIKPSNIVVDSTGMTKIVDFGIAKVLSPESGALSLTQTGEVFGSPLYMSPEQSAGAKLDRRADVYQLGCVLYEALTGVPPFSGENIYAVIQQHAEQMPASLRKHRSGGGVIDQLEAVVLRAMAKSPDDRYQTMPEFKQALVSVKPSGI